jgi:4-amino-4-deoxy-L-arabinose transferase-like glycosyltransferase
MTIPPARALLCRAALVLLAIAGVWALLVVATGGFAIHVGALRVSARRALNPSIAMLASAAAAWALATSAQRRRALAVVWTLSRGERGPLRVMRVPDTLARFIAFTAAVGVMALGLVRGSFVAAGADAYGYASQADLWASGRLIVEQPFAREMTWPNAAETLAPLGYRPYRPAPHGTDIVPVYSPGLPMAMATFKLVAGPGARFLVVPLLAGLAVWATYLMGIRVGGPLVGAAGAVLLASSPSFMVELVSVSSDAPVTAWWALALTLLLSDRRLAAFGAGLATGLAILTRPNLILLATVPGGFLIWRALRERVGMAPASGPAAPLTGGNHTARALLFAAGSIPGCLAVAGINWHLYG